VSEERQGDEPLPQCGLEPSGGFFLQDVPAPCQRCGQETRRGLVVCGWCAEAVGICVLCGGDLRNGRPDGWEYQREQ
jgi:hypothetical protein